MQRLDTFKDGVQDLVEFWRGVKWIVLISKLFLNCTIKVLSWYGSGLTASIIYHMYMLGIYDTNIHVVVVEYILYI